MADLSSVREGGHKALVRCGRGGDADRQAVLVVDWCRRGGDAGTSYKIAGLSMLRVFSARVSKILKQQLYIKHMSQ